MEGPHQARYAGGGAAAGIPDAWFSTPMVKPGTVFGPLSLAVEAEVGYASTVILPATHDTGSAYMTIARDFKVTLRESFLD